MSYNNIHIYVRQFSRNRINPDRPKWFDYEKVFQNLLKTKNDNICKLNVCFEFEGDYDKHFIKRYSGFNLHFIDTDRDKWTGRTFEDANWSRSVAATSEIILNDIKSNKITENDLIYILEDDYLHIPYWSEIVLDFFNVNLIYSKNDYVCLYDHNDKYLFTQSEAIINQYNLEKHWGMYKDLQSKIILSNNRHWRSMPNCGLSMIMPRDLFLRDIELWGRGYSDCEIGYQIKTRYNTSIWTPMPSLNTHCVNPFVAPLINWEKIINL